MALDKQKISKKWIIGKNDIADLPLYNLKHVNIKIDSGAYTSTIHCKEINLVNNQLQVVFLDENQKGYTGEKFIFDSFKQKK
ncbi:hypothetical protein CW751_14630 [Brumimicrobium salinarum]|uniref:Peptidase n=1 Tax=Brumimicrobium salinarum TaxID=2058658 RepID=A0A2I0QYW5_9FLAO|nr:hypothetical protein [Brumimicrobium salinarum]PKR79533.1 hypothetical protein CW751_14630 [Brumimicrobium salinarum]